MTDLQYVYKEKKASLLRFEDQLSLLGPIGMFRPKVFMKDYGFKNLFLKNEYRILSYQSTNPMNLNQQIGLLTIRVLLGLIFFMQGFGKVFKFGLERVYDGFFKPTYSEILPDLVLIGTAYYTSFVELVGGFLLILGLFRSYSLYALASVLVIVTFGHGLVEPIWDLSNVMYRTVLLISLLLLPQQWDKFSLDNMMQKRKN